MDSSCTLSVVRHILGGGKGVKSFPNLQQGQDALRDSCAVVFNWMQADMPGVQTRLSPLTKAQPHPMLCQRQHLRRRCYFRCNCCISQALLFRLEDPWASDGPSLIRLPIPATQAKAMLGCGLRAKAIKRCNRPCASTMRQNYLRAFQVCEWLSSRTRLSCRGRPQVARRLRHAAPYLVAQSRFVREVLPQPLVAH